MTTLTPPMIRLIQDFTAGTVATVNDDGTPAASPKATFVVKDATCIAFGNIRSPATVANIRARPEVETVFVDVLTRRAVRVAGRATVVDKTSDAGRSLMPVFEEKWGPFLDAMSEFVQIDISSAELILSPAYDLGLTAEELRQSNLDALNAL
jgi:hypothetical protein